MIRRFLTRADQKGTNLGSIGERHAVRFLEERGYKIVRRNFSCSGGEIDVIAEDNGVLVFVEVKTRESVQFGQPYEAVTPSKQRRMTHAALTYLKALAELPPCRFDVVSIRTTRGSEHVELYRDAFEPTGWP